MKQNEIWLRLMANASQQRQEHSRSIELTTSQQGIALVISLLAFVPLMFYEGWAISEVWRMLFVPAVMHYAELNVPLMNAGLAAAFVMTFRTFSASISKAETDTLKTLDGIINTIARALVRPAIMVLCAWILALFVFGGR